MTSSWTAPPEGLGCVEGGTMLTLFKVFFLVVAKVFGISLKIPVGMVPCVCVRECVCVCEAEGEQGMPY